MDSKTYWAKREAEALKHYITDEAEYDRQIKQIYQDMLDSCQTQINDFYGRYAAKEGITLAEAKKRVSKLDIEKYERKAKRYVKDKDFSDKANEEMRLYNATMKINRLEMLKANIGLELIAGHNELEKFMGDILKGRTEEELKRQAGILGKTIRNNAQLAHAIPNASFHNATFSDRIWLYQDILRADLSKLLQTGLIQGKNPRVLARELKKKFGESTYNTERLMRTELARVQTEAQKQSFERNGFEKYIFIVNGGCCSDCEAAKNKDIGYGKGVYLVKDMMPGENASPIHPHCRCSTAAYEDSKEYEEWLDFLANGGTTAEWEKLKAATPKPAAAKKPLDISSMTEEEFEQWKKAYYDDVNGNVQLTAAELKALDDYGEGSYELLNAYGRYGADSDKFKAVLKKYGNSYTTAEIEEKFNAVQSALNKFSLNESIIVHRAVRDISFMTDDISVEGLKKLKGKTITEGGFVSTSLAYQRKFEGKNPNAVHIEYVLPKGTKGAYIDKFVAKDEHEFLLSAGTKYKIVDGGERVVKVPKYDFKLRKWVEIEKTERFLKAEVIPDILTDITKSSTISKAKFNSFKLSGIDKDYISDITDTFNGLMNDYPVSGLNVKTNNASREFGHYVGGIKGVKKDGKQYAVFDNEVCISKMLQKNKATSTEEHIYNYGERGSALKNAKRVDLATIPHEYGHAIDSAYAIAKDPALKAFAEKYKTAQKLSFEDIDKINSFNMKLNNSDKRLSKEIFDELQKEYNLDYMGTVMRIDAEYGSYASSSVAEFLAEGFANMRMLPESEKTDFMKSFEKIFNRKFNEVLGG